MNRDKLFEILFEHESWKTYEGAYVFNEIRQSSGGYQGEPVQVPLNKMIDKALEYRNQEWINGYRCGSCGGKKKPGLSDTCIKCLETQ